MKLNDYELDRLRENNLTLARKLCDRHVGKGLYPLSYLRSIMDDPSHDFYIITKNGEVAGYFYSEITRADALSHLPGLDYSAIAHLCRPDDNIVIFKSMGIEQKYRGEGLSDTLFIHFKNDYVRRHDIVLILAAAWSQDGYVPVKKLLLRTGFQYLCTLSRPWSNVRTLDCPYCRQKRCVCDSAVYYDGARHEKEKTKTVL